jgi:hypothetical protein
MDLQTINTIWRPVYGKLQKGIRLLLPEWKNLKKVENFRQLSLRQINWPVELVNGGGIVFTSDGGSTAKATSNEPPEATDSWIHMAGRFEIGYDAISMNNDGRVAAQQIKKQLGYQAADKLRSLQRAVAIGFYGFPDATLFLAEGTASNPSGNQTRVRLKDLYGITGLTPRNVRSYITKDKDIVAVHSGATATVRGSGKVIAINESTLDIDLDSASAFHLTVAAGDNVVLFNQALTGAADDFNLGINGLLHLMTSDTVHGISATNQPDWDVGFEVANLAAALSGASLYKAFEEIEQESNMRPQWVWTTTGAIAAAGGAELDQRRYGADEDTMRLGFRKLNIMGVQAEGRPYCPAGYAFIGSNSALRRIAPDEDPKDLIQSGDRSGGFKQYENTLGFYKDIVFRTQLAVTARKGLGYYGGVTES